MMSILIVLFAIGNCITLKIKQRIMKRLLIILVVLVAYVYDVNAYTMNHVDGKFTAVLNNTSTPPVEETLLCHNYLKGYGGYIWIELEEIDDDEYYEWSAVDSNGNELRLTGKPNGNAFGLSLPSTPAYVTLTVTIKSYTSNIGYLARATYTFVTPSSYY